MDVPELKQLWLDADRLREAFNLQSRIFNSHRDYVAGLDIDVASEFPAQRLIRLTAEGASESAWRGRWQAAGGRLFGGQMIALKWDVVWAKVSDFGLPYPPFSVSAEMDVEDVDRDEAVALKLIGRRDVIERLVVGPFDEQRFREAVLRGVGASKKPVG